MIVGTQQVSLLPVTPEEFQKLSEGTLTQEELMARALERIEIRRKQTESMEINPKDLYDIYTRMARAGNPAPVNLSAIWEALCESQYLRDIGCIVSKESSKLTLISVGLEYIPDGSVLTVSRDLYEAGLGEGGTRVHFASYGDPYFDSILEHFSSFDLPECICRISVPVHGMDGVEMVGYAVACRNPGGGIEVRLVCSWQDINGLNLAEEVSLTDADVAPLREQLERIARNELEPCIVANRIERGNMRAAYAHEILNYLVARGLFESNPLFTVDGSLFGQVRRQVEALYESRDQVNLPYLPSNVLNIIKEDLLFECHVPAVGDKAQICVPYILAQTALNAASRLVESMKVKKSEHRMNRVIARLQREIDAKMRLVGQSK